MLGDRLHTDIAVAGAAGMDSALVLTGDSTLADVAAVPQALRPTWVLDRLDRLRPALGGHAIVLQARSWPPDRTHVARYQQQSGRRRRRPRTRPYHKAVLEAVYTGLLVLSSLAIGWVGLLVIYKLFAGQR